MPLREVWWFAQGHPADTWGEGEGVRPPGSCPRAFPDPGLQAAIPAVHRQRPHRPGGPVLLKASLLSPFPRLPEEDQDQPDLECGCLEGGKLVASDCASPRPWICAKGTK